jgi:thioredoxin-related protein
MQKKCGFLCVLFLLISSAAYSAAPAIDKNLPILADAEVVFEDSQLAEELIYPDWFKFSLGDLNDDLEEAKQAGKKGIITYFGQKRCAYCEQFFKTSLADTDIKNYLQQYYDIIAFDIWGIETIIDTDGKQFTERELSIRYQANFTPSLVFYNSDGTPVFRLRGFYPPYKFRAALIYVTEGFYKKETFAEYFERANPGEFFLSGGLTERNFFLEKPYDLSSLNNNDRATAVFFEQGNCHACDLLHSGPLSKNLSLAELDKMNVIQLNMWKDTPITTPKGVKTTAKKWAKSLDTFYAPSIIFFDSNGEEIMRVDSVTYFYRLWGVLDYINRKGYEQTKDYQAWRLQQREIQR